MKFLTIDNQPLIQFGLQSMIEQEFPGAAISQFEGIHTALEAIRLSFFDLIFLGLNENEDDVQSWITKAKTASPKSRMMIYLPFEADEENNELYIRAGADDVISYKMGLDDIAAHFKALLETKAYQRGHI